MWCARRLGVAAVVVLCMCDVGWAQQQQIQQQQHSLILPALQPQHTQPIRGVPLPLTPQAQSPTTLPDVAGHVPQGTHMPPGGHVPQFSEPQFDVDPVVVVPLEHGGPGRVGVPLPPYRPTGTTGGAPGPDPVLGGGGPGGLLGVRDPVQDNDVQRIMQMPVLFHHLQASSRADHALRITEIISAQKQVVSGQLIYLTLRAAETLCPRGTPDVERCQIDPHEDEYICEVVVWERSWLNSTKIIHEKSRCADTEDDVDFKNYGGHLPLLATSPSEQMLTTLPHQIEEQQVVAEAFSFIDRGSDSDFRGRMVDYDLSNIRYDPVTNTTRVQVNVEYGFTLCLKSPTQMTDPRSCPHDNTRQPYVCSVFVVHSPNSLTPLEVIPILDDLDDIHCEKKRTLVPVEEELVVAVEAPCSGCPQPLPLTDPAILDIADFAITEYDRSTDDDELHAIVRLIKAHSQVVAGIKYFLTVEVADTDCKKMVTGVDVNRTFCNPDPTDTTDICELHVIDQPWIPARDLVMARCQDKDQYSTSAHDEFIVPMSHGTNLGAAPGFGAAPGVGGVEVDAATMNVVNTVVAEFNRLEDDTEYSKFIRVHDASSQVVSGVTVYHVAVEIGETLCNKHDPATGQGEHCAFDPREETEVCEAEVHDQPGPLTPNSRRIISLSCDDLDDYLKKKLMPTVISFTTMHHPFLDEHADNLAGYQSVATNDSTVSHLANFVLDQYNLHGDEDELYALTKVVSAHSQVSGEGTKYHLELELAETHCKKYLVVPDPSRCPIDHSEDLEICQTEVLVPTTPGSTMQITKLYCDEIDDYYTRRIRGRQGQAGRVNPQSQGSGVWSNMNINDTSLTKLGHRIANEYDARSDDDNLFIFHKIIRARKQVTSGIKYHLIVELQETVCPKYKRRIHKDRCVPDIGEEHMVCEANILTQPWMQKLEVSSMRCAEKDDFFEGDDSVEVLYPNVHPSAHARPVFQSHFLVRGSDESDESNERFYDPSRRSTSRSLESKEDDSDERFYHPSGRRNFSDEDDDDDDDDDDDSDEYRYRVRGKRAALGAPEPVDSNDSTLKELAEYAFKTKDQLSEDPYVWVVEEVISATKQVVAGLNWTIEMALVKTTCLKSDQNDESTCEKDPEEPRKICKANIYQKPWTNFKQLKKMTCKPGTVKKT